MDEDTEEKESRYEKFVNVLDKFLVWIIVFIVGLIVGMAGGAYLALNF